LSESVRREAFDAYTKKLNGNDKDFNEKITSLLQTANLAREGLLRIDSYKQDKKADAIFAKVEAGEPITWSEMVRLTSYFWSLYDAAATKVSQANH
jgi:uncharacterized coiled-coil DUF342 family protein